MKTLKEPQGISRRQFLKGIGALAILSGFSGWAYRFGRGIYAVRDEYIRLRIAGLYQNDAQMPIRKSHENPEIQELYQNFLTRPLSPKSHHLLHTHYHSRVELTKAA